MSQPLNEIERIHYYILSQWLEAMRNDDDELRAYYYDAADVIYELIPEYEVRVNPLLAKLMEIAEKWGVKL